MMGRQDAQQGQFLYHFNLDDLIPEDHLLRKIDTFLDLSTLRQHLEPYYSHTGRPSIDPELILRMLIVGYCYGIRSERRLCEEVKLNLGYRWFCRLSIEDPVPDHSSLSKNRHGRFRESEALRFVFEQVVDRCIAEQLVGGAGFAVDASIVKADASRQKAINRDDDDEWPRPGGSSRAVREYLEALDEGAQPAKRVSTTDPAAQWTAAPGGPAFFAYSTNYLIDTVAGIILDVEATTANRKDEVASTKVMVDRVKRRFDLKPNRLAGDTAYGTAEMLSWMVDEQRIEPHVPVWDKSEGQDGVFGRSDFTWQAEKDRYVCPAGKKLIRNRRKFKKPRTGITKENMIIYSAGKAECEACPKRQQCCPVVVPRRIRRSIHEEARDVARALAKTESYAHSRNERKKVEMLFGHMKRILKLDRLRLRGITGASDEFLMTAAVQNLRRLAQWLGHGPPDPGVSAS